MAASVLLPVGTGKAWFGPTPTRLDATSGTLDLDDEVEVYVAAQPAQAGKRDLDSTLRTLRMTCWQGRMDELATGLGEARPALLASGDPRHQLWANALRARLILHDDDPSGATQLVSAAHDAFLAATDGPQRANSIAFLSELYAQAGHAELATDLTIIAGQIVDHAQTGSNPSPDLVEACCWLSRSLATLGMFEPAALFADRGMQLTASSPGGRYWPGLSRCGAFMHLLRAEELNRAGEAGPAAVHVAAAEAGLAPVVGSGEAGDVAFDEAMTMLLAGWVALTQSRLDAADALLARTTILADNAGVGWIEAAAKYLHGRCARQAGDLSRAAALLAEAASGLARWSWHPMQEWCLLTLVDLETQRGQGEQALRWIAQYLQRRKDTLRRRHELATELFQRRVAVQNAQRERSTVARQAVEDALTGLPNRRRVEQRLADLLTDPSQAPVSLAVVDIDQFKRINDQTSHIMGDDVLVCVASLISTQSRRRDLVGRWAGDEFVVVMPATTEEEAILAMELVRLAVADHHWGQIGLPTPVSVSIGLAVATPGTSARSLFDAADAPLFAAKRAGRNLVLNAGATRSPSRGGAVRAAS